MRRRGPRTPARTTPSRPTPDRKSTRLNSSHLVISYAVFCLKKKQKHTLPERAHPAAIPYMTLPGPPVSRPESKPTQVTLRLIQTHTLNTEALHKQAGHAEPL